MGKGGGGAAKWMKQLATDQQAMGKDWLALGKSYIEQTRPYLESAGNYWSTLLRGDKAAVGQLVGPSAENISGQYTAARKNIETFMPRGGERNLAVAGTDVGRASDIARLYAGVQPMAASQLAALSGQGAGAAGTVGGVGTGLTGQATSGGSSLLNYYAQTNAGISQMWGGVASGLGSLAGGQLGSKGGSSSGGKGSSGGGGQISGLLGSGMPFVGMPCWLAFATFGESDTRAWRLRFYILNRAANWLRRLYFAIGPSLAEAVKASPLLHSLSYRSLSFVEARL